MARLRKRVAQLRDFPELGAVVEDYNDSSVREIVFQDQRIVYRFDHAEVLILTVFHGSHTPNLARFFGD